MKVYNFQQLEIRLFIMENENRRNYFVLEKQFFVIKEWKRYLVTFRKLTRRKKTSSHSLDDSGGKDGYDPGSLLKSAVDKSKTKGSPKNLLLKSLLRKTQIQARRKSPKIS